MNPVLVLNERIAVANIDGAGVAYEVIMKPQAFALEAFGNPQECISTANGYLSMTFTVAGITAASAHSVVIGVSPSPSAQAAVKTAVDAVTNGLYATPNGTLESGVFTLPAVPGAQITIQADRLAPWKTIGTGLTGSIPGLLLIAQGTKAS